MELYASGFNAWHQLCFNGSDDHDEPEDIPSFTCVLAGHAIEHPRAFLSHTSVIVDGRLRTAGHVPKEHLELQDTDPVAYSTIAEASNAAVAVLDSYGHVRQYGSLHKLLGKEQAQTFPDLPKFEQVVAYETGFAALTSAGHVYTWGDSRYSACLGREVSEDSPEDRPGLVTALHDLPTGPISKIAAGGYILAALTSGDDLYLWGGHPGRKTVPADVADEPAPVVIDEQDIIDIAVGDSHLIALTSRGQAFVIGENVNGQLGLPVKSVDSWAQVELDLRGDQRVVGVAAGPRSNFIIVQQGEAR